MNFTVELTNVSGEDFSFDSGCPNYILIIGDKDVYDTHSLNCSPVPAILPGQHVLFAMKAAIPPDLALGSYDASWSLDASYVMSDASWYAIEFIAP